MAAKTSIRLAFVTMARLTENRSVKLQTTARRAARSPTKYRMIIEINGVMEARIVPRISMVPIITASEYSKRLLGDV